MEIPEGWPTDVEEKMKPYDDPKDDRAELTQWQIKTKMAELRELQKSLAAAPTSPVPILQLETQLSDRDVKALSDYLAQVRATATPPAQEVAYHGETSNQVADHKAENVSNKSPAQEVEHDSYLTNCHIISRQEEDKPLFVGSGEKVFCRLDRYTILPTEQYDKLRKAAEEVVQLIGLWINTDEIILNIPEAVKVRNLRAALEGK